MGSSCSSPSPLVPGALRPPSPRWPPPRLPTSPVPASPAGCHQAEGQDRPPQLARSILSAARGAGGLLCPRGTLVALQTPGSFFTKLFTNSPQSWAGRASFGPIPSGPSVSPLTAPIASCPPSCAGKWHPGGFVPHRPRGSRAGWPACAPPHPLVPHPGRVRILPSHSSRPPRGWSLSTPQPGQAPLAARLTPFLPPRLCHAQTAAAAQAMAGASKALVLHVLLCFLCRDPPEPPGNLTCTIGERSGSLACTWDAGRPTHLRTDYRLHLNSTQTAEEEVFPAGSPVPLSALRGGSRYSAWVQARNALGAARSAPRHLDLRELVVPALPLAEGAETTLASPPITTVRWRQQTQLENVHCEERHKAEDAPMWHVEAWDRAVRAGHPLQSDTRYVFQARCRLSPADSPWSAWSPPFVYTTPEAAPAAAPDVWRRLGPAFPNGSHEVTVLIKPLPPRAARGRILGYAVAAGSAQPLCNTSGTSCSVLVPPGVRVLHVTAHNSRGASSPANVTLGREAGQQAFPAPAAVEVRRQNQSSISVAWQPPRGSRSPPLWFIVEWVSTAPYSKEERFFWKKVPCQDTLTYIQEDAAAASHINVSVYAVYPDGVSKPTSGQVSSEERIPDFSYNETSHDDDTGVFLGMGVSVIVSSVVLAILMFKKSARIRIKATVASLLPKWLLEDFPHMENSNVIKSLQEKSEFTSNSSYEPFLDDSDPTVMEIEEVSVHEKYKIVDIKKKPSTVVPENVVHPQSSASAVSAAPEHVSDYKPQISDGNLLGYVAANIYQAESHTPAPEPETTFFFRDYTSPVSYLWNAEGAGHNVCLLEKINLILNNNRSGQNYAFSSAQEEQSTLLESQWGKTLSSENVQEQTLVPDELVSCLRAMNEEPVDIQTCLQQRIGRLF
uniref:Fibronectin type-III domain-containing protein n=1 Tax=Anser brachyrhynchus TaxID=132585 RepID=A0A8B9CKF9_9AVES